mmetsp:Transcript_30624/g.101875  ORF Transcript_30624/g.101875 Transcript_30624/m.101875 type:complete len:204 (+) Transcript_30624:714-1325(+)
MRDENALFLIHIGELDFGEGQNPIDQSRVVEAHDFGVHLGFFAQPKVCSLCQENHHIADVDILAIEPEETHPVEHVLALGTLEAQWCVNLQDEEDDRVEGQVAAEGRVLRLPKLHKYVHLLPIRLRELGLLHLVEAVHEHTNDQIDHDHLDNQLVADEVRIGEGRATTQRTLCLQLLGRLDERCATRLFFCQVIHKVLPPLAC